MTTPQTAQPSGLAIKRTEFVLPSAFCIWHSAEGKIRRTAEGKIRRTADEDGTAKEDIAGPEEEMK